MTESALSEAVSAAGGASVLARQLGVTRQAISQWDRVPAERAIQVEAASGVSRERLRPDLYPPAAIPDTVEPPSDTNADTEPVSGKAA